MRIRSRVDGVYVYGWYFYSSGQKKHMLHLLDDESGVVAVEIDPSLTSLATGKKDKNGEEIFGSKGEFTDGDNICSWPECGNHYPVEWDKTRLTWMAGMDLLGEVESDIIPKEQE